MILISSLLIVLLQSVVYSQQTISAVYWTDDIEYTRLYIHEEGSIVEYAKDGEDDWYLGDFSYKGTTVGAISYFMEEEIKIRVYVGNKNTVQEYVYDKGWKKGSFKATGRVADATYYIDDEEYLHIKVYVVKSNNAIIKYAYDEDKVTKKFNGWSKGKRVSIAK